jgi:hypothetical protein
MRGLIEINTERRSYGWSTSLDALSPGMDGWRSGLLYEETLERKRESPSNSPDIAPAGVWLHYTARHRIYVLYRETWPAPVQLGNNGSTGGVSVDT